MRRVLAALLVSLLAGPALSDARCADHVPQARPQNTAREFVGQDLDEIQDRGWIEFAVYENFPPYSFMDGTTPAGVDIDIGTLIAGELGVEPRFRMVAAGETLEVDLMNYVWKGAVIGGRVSNVMLRVPYDSAFACRVDQVVFTGQYHREGIAIAYRKDAYPDDPPVPAYFRFDTVAVANDSIADFYLTSLSNGQMNANIRRFPDMAAAMAALNAGEVMAAMGPLGQIEGALTEATAVHQPPLPAFSVGKWTIGVAVHQSHRPLAYAVDDAIAAGLADGRIAGIFARHGLTFTEPAR